MLNNCYYLYLHLSGKPPHSGANGTQVSANRGHHARVNIPLEVREHPLKLMLEEAGLPIPTTEIGYQEWRQSFQSKHP